MSALASEQTATPVEAAFGAPERQNRATIFFRIIMVIPQVVVLYFVGIAAAVVLVIGWFGALFTGRLPDFAAEFLSGFLRWGLRVESYLYFLTGKYPPFSLQPSADYPVELDVRSGPLNRLAVFFRVILVIPAWLVAAVVGWGLGIFSIVIWVVTLVRGEPPRSFYEASAAAIRYRYRVSGYFVMLTSVYPGALYGDSVAAVPGRPASVPATPPGTAAPLVPGMPPPPMPPVEGQTPYPSAGPTPEPGAPPVPGAPPGPMPVPDAPPVAGYDAPPVAGYGAPPAPGYGAPLGPVAATRPAAAWRLFLSATARRLVTAFVVIGAVALVADVALPVALSSSNSAAVISAQNQAVDAYNSLANQASQFTSQTTSCTQQGTTALQLQCLETADGKFAQNLTAFSDRLATIDFPSSVATQVAAVRVSVNEAATILEQLSRSGSDPQAYQRAVQTSGIQAAVNRVDSSFSALNAALRAQV